MRESLNAFYIFRWDRGGVPVNDFWNQSSSEQGLRNAELLIDQATALSRVVSVLAVAYQPKTFNKYIFYFDPEP